MQNSNVGKKIIIYFSDKNKKIINSIKKKESEIKQKEQSLISQKNILETIEYNKKVESIKKEIIIFNNSNKAKLDNLKIQRDEVTKSFLVEINKILKEYAEKNNIDIIFSSKQMLIGKSNLDITDKILIEVNKKIKKFDIKNNG